MIKYICKFTEHKWRLLNTYGKYIMQIDLIKHVNIEYCNGYESVSVCTAV